MIKDLYAPAVVFALVSLMGCKERPPSDPSGMSRYTANGEVARFMENYEGRGVLTDPDSEPLPAGEAVSGFSYPEDLELELVLSEPDIIQPLQVSFDHRGRLWVVQYHQYPYPEGLKITAIDNHTRVKFDRVPEAPPQGISGADKITFFEDTDGDGSYDRSTDAVTGLNIATGVALGRGKIWVLNPPYLLAYPDPDGEGIPDGEPEVHLEGFGLEDTHAVANSLTWGPDGWLYGAQGSTTTADISSAATKNVAFQGQAIWRYHPETGVFEIFAEGGGNNAFNVEIDSKGRIFSGSNGYGRGPYYKQGAYYIKSWGKHGPLTNPYAFGFLPNMPLEGEKKRFTHSLIRYEGGSLPERYNGKMFAVNPLHNYVQLTDFAKEGSSFKNTDGPIVLETGDKWFRPVDIKLGPDGAVYMADWYDSRLSHVDPRDTWHKSSGRIYRLKAKGGPATVPEFDLSLYDNRQLTGLLSHENRWFRRQALRQFGDRKDPAALPLLLELFEKGNGQEALEALWAIHLTGGFTGETAVKALEHTDPSVRMWGVRLLGDHKKVSPEISRHLALLSAREPDPEVRGQLASSARRLPAADALPIIKNLLENHDDSRDPDIPLLIWWALESKADSDRASVLALFEEPEMWSNPVVEGFILNRLMRRYVMEGGEENFAACTRLLRSVPSDRHGKLLVAGLQEGLLGRDMVELPKELLKALEPYGDASGEAPLTMQLRQGDENALGKALEIIADAQAEIGERLAYIQITGETNQPASVPVLLNLVKDGQSSPVVKQAALHALQAYPDEGIGQQLARAYQGFRDNIHVREAALALFASRVSWAGEFLAEVSETRTVHADDVPLHLVKRFRLLGDAAVTETVDRWWPQSIPLTAAEKTRLINRYGEVLASGNGDMIKGKMLFLTSCGACHRIDGEGSLVGPELTGYDRSNPEYLLLHTVDPDADIREGYEVQRVVTSDGRTLEGRIRTQNGGTVVLDPPLGGKATILSKDKIKEMEIRQSSFMPERLLDSLSDQDIRDLFSYLMKSD
jgi:putative heme-binding domain-containing protein